MTSVAIMQPTFLPWIGYFSLIEKVDKFVFLDSVQFSKRSWQQRNQIKTPNGMLWLTVPVITKNLRDQSICDASILDDPNYPKKLLKNIENSYKKARFFGKYYPEIRSTIEEEKKSLSMLNISLINLIAHQIGISNTEFLKSSKMNVSGSKEELLVGICKFIDADKYISPNGSKDYLEGTTIFPDNKIDLIYHDYTHPSYDQIGGEFVPYVSVIDLLFNEGDNSFSILKNW